MEGLSNEGIAAGAAVCVGIAIMRSWVPNGSKVAVGIVAGLANAATGTAGASVGGTSETAGSVESRSLPSPPPPLPLPPPRRSGSSSACACACASFCLLLLFHPSSFVPMVCSK